MFRQSLAILLGVAVLAGCQTSPSAPPQARLFEGMGAHHRPITTSAATAQRYFDQGLTWTYAFNHGEAIRSFEAAAQADPNCAMAWWGVALCHGPHINNPATDATAAWDALKKAQERKAHASQVEQALIDALSHRYAQSQPTDRSSLDKAYADAMAAVHKRFPADTDVAVLYAEALMDLQPWDLWTPDGKPKGDTQTIVAVLEGVLRSAPRHVGACHLYIHAVEASPNPEKALPAADTLGGLVPAAGHLVHMPSHIYARTGRWSQAADANVAASAADRAYRAKVPRSGFWHVYMAHNNHFLAFAAMMEGRRQAAMQAARDMIQGVPADWARQNAAAIDGLMPIITDVMMRFGLWDDILKEPAPPEHFPIATAMWRFTRGVAFAAKGQVPEAKNECTAFSAAVRQVPQGAMIQINPAATTLSIADRVLRAEIAFREQKLDESLSLLREAIAVEDELRYMEPPEWMQPVRHTLGAFLVSAKRHKEAEEVYRQDVGKWPENGWSLFGLADCLRAQGKTAEADQVERRFKQAWARADTSIRSTCLCVSMR